MAERGTRWGGVEHGALDAHEAVFLHWREDRGQSECEMGMAQWGRAALGNWAGWDYKGRAGGEE